MKYLLMYPSYWYFSLHYFVRDKLFGKPTFMHVDELPRRMTPSQRKRSDEDFEEFYGKYKDLPPIYPLADGCLDNESFLRKFTQEELDAFDKEFDRKVDLENWK